jgi:hypothetical protein
MDSPASISESAEVEGKVHATIVSCAKTLFARNGMMANDKIVKILFIIKIIKFNNLIDMYLKTYRKSIN